MIGGKKGGGGDEVVWSSGWRIRKVGEREAEEWTVWGRRTWWKDKQRGEGRKEG